MHYFMGIKSVDPSGLKDIRDVVIDTSKPCQERIKDYINQMGNPYCYLDNGTIVEIGYSNTEVSLSERLASAAIIAGQKKGNL